MCIPLDYGVDFSFNGAMGPAEAATKKQTVYRSGADLPGRKIDRDDHLLV